MKNKIPLLLFFALLTAAGYLFLALFERYDTTEDAGWAAGARYNPYLAAEQFLARFGTTVNSARSLEKIEQLSAAGVVFVSAHSAIVNRRHIDRLVAWVENGGHLLVAAGPADEPHFLLAHFGISVTAAACACETDEAGAGPIGSSDDEQTKRLSEQLRDAQKRAQRGPGGDGMVIDESSLTELAFDDYDGILRIAFREGAVIEHVGFNDDEIQSRYEPFYWRGHDEGVHFSQFGVASGLLTVMTGDAHWRSDRIDQFDHAYLLWILMADQGDAVFLTGSQIPSLWHLMRQFAAEILFAGAVCLIAWLVFRSRRFGPTIEPQIGVRRSLAEHIKASAAYLWRRNAVHQLLEPVKEALVRRMQIWYPDFRDLPQQAQIDLLQKHTGLAGERIAFAWIPREINDEPSFQRLVRALQEIREAL